MKQKVIGIVLTKRTQEYIAGYLAKSNIGLNIDEDGKISVEEKITKYGFKLQMGRRKILSVKKEVEMKDAKEIGKRLKEIGFKSIILSYNEKEIPI